MLGRAATDAQSNEAAALPVLRDALARAGAIATVDATGRRPAVAGRGAGRGADSVPALEENRPTVHGVAADHCALGAADAAARARDARSRTVGKDHGRIAARSCRAADDPAVLARLDPDRAWPGLQGIAAVAGERRSGPRATADTRYDLSRSPADAARLAAAARSHGGIEHRRHGVLDPALREDAGRVRTGHAAANLAVPRRIALHPRRRERPPQAGIPAQRLKAGWDHDHRLRILVGCNAIALARAAGAVRRRRGRAIVCAERQFAYPDPPLSDGAIVLRPWTASDLTAISQVSRDRYIPTVTSVPAPYFGCGQARVA